MCIRDRLGAGVRDQALDGPLGEQRFGAGYQDPVSYTHLDVYKRQASAGSIPSGGAGSPSGSAEGAIGSV